jgi:hypothetical protein
LRVKAVSSALEPILIVTKIFCNIGHDAIYHPTKFQLVTYVYLYLFQNQATFPPEILISANRITDGWTQSTYNQNWTTLYCNLNGLEYNKNVKTQQNPCQRKPIVGKKISHDPYGAFDRVATQTYLLVIKKRTNVIRWLGKVTLF